MPEVTAQAFAATRPGGRCVMVGSPPTGSVIPIDGRLLFSERRLLGCTAGSSVPAVDIPRIVALQQQGRLDLDRMISMRVPLERFGEAVAAAEAGEVARSVVVIG